MKKQEKPSAAVKPIPPSAPAPLKEEALAEATASALLSIDKGNKAEMLDRLMDSINTSLAVSTAFLSSAPGTLTAVELRKMCKIHQGIYSLIADIQKIGITNIQGV